MGHLVTVATCNLNQWAMDFEGNRDRIIQSIVQARSRNAIFRTGPELEITGYGCLDYFLESDTYLASWDMWGQIVSDKRCQDILLDIGLPIIHNSVRYNCRVISYNNSILLIRPKIWLANDGNDREMRYFTPWARPMYSEKHILPPNIQKITKMRTATFGDAILDVWDTAFGFETCEELFTPNSPHIGQALAGVEIFTNSSGSHHELRKLNTRLELITEATKKCGGVYLYANQRGCDGDRLYYDGCALIVVNGKVVAQGAQFGLQDVEVVTATVDLDDVRTYRSSPSFGLQSTSMGHQYPREEHPDTSAHIAGRKSEFDPTVVPNPAIELRYHTPEEEIALGPACWLWDYLRRCRAGGFFIPLSGGIDSCATSVIVFSMCRLVVDAITNGNEQVLKDARTLTGKTDTNWVPETPQELANIIFHTCYMGTENSSKETRERAKDLAVAIGSYHVDLNMDILVSATTKLFQTVTGKTPQFKVHGGSHVENLALQNIQARLRMVLAYLFALLLPWVRGKSSGGLLVLGSANVDESLRGYLTKYDCSSADINPIGGISKTDLKKFISYARDSFDLPILDSFLNATPTAELEPITKTYVQSDEADMGMTYDELSVFGRLRKVDKCGPYSAFLKLYHEWTPRLSPAEISAKVKRFFYYYAINRHKMTVLTPAYHAEQYSPDDNRFDLRPFLILPGFPWAFKKIDEVVKSFESGEKSKED
jgi:NAD+ synthase (glutamine-hydrolysing)